MGILYERLNMSRLKITRYDNGSNQNIIWLGGSLQSVNAKKPFFNSLEHSDLVSFSKQNNFNVYFLETHLKTWCGGRRPKIIEYFAREIYSFAVSLLGEKWLCGFSDGCTMAQYCMAWYPVFDYYVFHSGLMPDIDMSKVKDQNIKMYVGLDDRFGTKGIFDWYEKAYNLYSKSNNVQSNIIEGLDHHWYREANAQIFTRMLPSNS